MINKKVKSFKTLRDLPTITQLNVYYEKNDENLDSLSALTRLSSLVAHAGNECNINQYLPILSHLPLKNLECTLRSLTPHDAENLLKLTGLQTLNLRCSTNHQGSHEPLYGFPHSHFSKLSKLNSLNLSWTNPSDESIIALRPMSNLTSLQLAGNHCSTIGMQSLQSMTNLREIDLSMSSSLNRESIVYITKLVNLEKLNFAYNQHVYSSSLIPNLSHLTKLQDLNLREMGINDRDVAALKPLEQLEKLNIANCILLTHEALESLSAHSKLKTLGLSGCLGILSENFTALNTFATLQELSLDGTKVSDEDIAQFVPHKMRLKSLSINDCTEITELSLEHFRKFTSLNRVSWNSLYSPENWDRVFSVIPNLKSFCAHEFLFNESLICK